MEKFFTVMFWCAIAGAGINLILAMSVMQESPDMGASFLLSGGCFGIAAICYFASLSEEKERT